VSASVERDPGAPLTQDPAFAAALAAQAIPPLAFDLDLESGYRLPPDHPPWPRDLVSISQRARALIARLKPVVVAAIAAWQHKLRAIVVGGRRVSIDATGSYRVD
jgi:hypothetical protein